jgi:hypothetical protein
VELLLQKPQIPYYSLESCAITKDTPIDALVYNEIWEATVFEIKEEQVEKGRGLYNPI